MTGSPNLTAAESGAPRKPRSQEVPAPDVGFDHFRAYQPRPFTRAERDDVTLLFGGLNWRAERVMQGAIENRGYRTRVLPPATRGDLLAGREVADIGQCCPTSFTTGNLVNFLRAEAARLGAEEVSRRYVYLTAGSCGACRFGQYHQSYELALRNIGMESFRMFLLAQDGLDQGAARGGGLELDLPFVLGAVWAILLSDLVTDLDFRIRPYEVVPGATGRAARESVEHLYQTLRRRPPRGRGWGSLAWHLATPYFVRALREVCERFDAVEVDRLRVKPVVKITGEFYLQTVEGAPNYDIHAWLGTEGAEVYPAAVTVWLDYLLRLEAQALEDRTGIVRHARAKRAGIATLRWALRSSHERMRRALNNIPRALPRQETLRDLAAPYFHSRMNGGEGDMLIGKALWAHQQRKAHMICELSPYSCMPNTMSVGAMAGVLGRHPDLLYAPIEVKGDAEVHALSRCQMILTEAKKRARSEFDDRLERSGLSVEDIRAYLDDHPRMRRAMFRIPDRGAAGTAANLVAHVAATRIR